MNSILFLAANAAAASPAVDPGAQTISTILSFGVPILLLVALYFFMIRPQSKQDKQIQQMRSELKVGDEITTIGGIIGKIISIKEETVMIETGHDRTKIRILREAVKRVDVHAEDAQ